jgi:hypothetical protein
MIALGRSTSIRKGLGLFDSDAKAVRDSVDTALELMCPRPREAQAAVSAGRGRGRDRASGH